MTTLPTTIAATLYATLHEHLKIPTIPREVVKTPQVLAAFIQLFDHHPAELGCFTLEKALEDYVGTKLETLLPTWLRFHAHLTSLGYTPTHPFEYGGCDREVYNVYDTPDRKALIAQTQNYRFLVLFMKAYTQWTVHVRTLSFTTHGVTLASVRRTQFTLQPHNACRGLRYGDLRDTGYVISLKHGPFGPSANQPTVNWPTLRYFLYEMASVVDCLQEIHPDPTVPPVPLAKPNLS